MKKLLLTSLVIACSANVIAADKKAVLNVEGEIQINGTTVINGDGQWVGDSTNVQPKLIDLDYYWPTEAKKIVLERVREGTQGYPEYTEQYIFTYGENGVSKSEELYVDGKPHWSLEWSDRTDTSFKSVETGNRYNGQTSEICVTNNEYDIIVNTAAPSVPLGFSTARAEILARTHFDEKCSPISPSSMNQDLARFAQKAEVKPRSSQENTTTIVKNVVTYDLAAKFDYPTADGGVLSDCILTTQSVPWSEKKRNMVLCKGLGFIEMGDTKYGDWVFKSVE